MQQSEFVHFMNAIIENDKKDNTTFKFSWEKTYKTGGSLTMASIELDKEDVKYLFNRHKGVVSNGIIKDIERVENILG